MSDEHVSRMVNIYRNSMAQTISSMIQENDITESNSVGDLLRVIRGEKVQPTRLIGEQYTHTELHPPREPHICYRLDKALDQYKIWHSTWNSINRFLTVNHLDEMLLVIELINDISRMTGHQILLVDYDALEERQTNHALKVQQMMSDNV